MTIDERLFVGTASEEHVEMYLKAMWLITENNKPIKISTIANLLRIRQPSVVQMMKKRFVSSFPLRSYNPSANTVVTPSIFMVPTDANKKMKNASVHQSTLLSTISLALL